MSRRATFLVFRAEQPDDAAWNAALAFAGTWNARSPAHPLQPVLGASLRTAAIDVADPEYRALRTELDALARAHHVVFLEDVEERVEQTDIAAADFVELLGVGIDGFVTDDSAEPTLPCPTCRKTGTWMAPQRAPFVVDDSELLAAANAPTGTAAAPAGGWEVVNLPDGGLAVSARVLDVLRGNAATGWDTRPLVTATGAPSRMVQLIARTFIGVPCPLHPDAEATSVCPTCGLVLDGRIEMGWHVRREAIEDRAVFSRHPFLAAELYVQRTVYEAFMAAGVAGLDVTITARLCDHTG